MEQNISISIDGAFDIAIGRSRKETHWKNKEIQWSDFLRKVSNTYYSAEKYSEYMGEKKARQDEIKDIGGFVGGYINNGRRKSENIIHRQLVTLDIDFASNDIWDDYTLLYSNAAALYSTHKHSLTNPRFRLIMPLDRPVAPDEYVAIARRIAGNLGINSFDDTTYEPCRLMYWPSTSNDAEYVFKYQDGPWLCADEVLASYKNWRDASEWPVSDRAGEVIRREIKKQGDPLEKPGLVGAFCRTYDIHEAIELFLDDVYISCDMENRYTYKDGSTAAGLVTYDDKYAYSHHGTDPASGKLCNAFDLVRLHLYGLRDEDAKEDTPSNRLPSYTAMVDFASKDSKVRKRLGIERLQEVKGDFAEAYTEEERIKVNVDWLGQMDMDKRGGPLSTANNCLLILQNDAELSGITYNEFKNTKDVIHPLPWREANDLGCWRDGDNANLYLYVEKIYGIANEGNLKRALKAILEARKYHPVRDYLNSLTWDGEKRVEYVFIDYLGADDTEYTQAITRKSLVAAVARIFCPGIKWDYSIILSGEQGIGKSFILQKLGHIDKGWFSDNFNLKGTKEDIEQLLGNWIIEMCELAGLSKRSVDDIKSYTSRQEDQCRLAFSEEKSYFKRQCVFFGTTNNTEFLRDSTGNRRFWPLRVGVHASSKNVFKELDEAEIDQIWAEAVALYKAGEPLFLSKDVEAKAKEMQEEHTEHDERQGIIQAYLDTLLPDNWDDMSIFERRNYLSGDELATKGTVRRDRVCVVEIWCELFGKDKADLDRRRSNEITGMLSRIEGWGRVNTGGGIVRFKIYGRQLGFDRQIN